MNITFLDIGRLLIGTGVFTLLVSAGKPQPWRHGFQRFAFFLILIGWSAYGTRVQILLNNYDKDSTPVPRAASNPVETGKRWEIDSVYPLSLNRTKDGPDGITPIDVWTTKTSSTLPEVIDLDNGEYRVRFTDVHGNAQKHLCQGQPRIREIVQ